MLAQSKRSQVGQRDRLEKDNTQRCLLREQQGVLRRIGRLLLVWLALVIAAGITFAGLITLTTVQPIAAQQSSSPGTTINTGAFPEITVTFDCGVEQLYTTTYRLLEDSQQQAIITTNLSRTASLAQVAIFLDLFRDDQPQIPRAASELLALAGDDNDLGDYLARLADSNEGFFIDPKQDLLGIFVPGPDLTTPRRILASRAFTYDVNSLFNGLGTIFATNADTTTSAAHLIKQPTTRLLDNLVKVLEAFDETANKQKTLIVFSDGTDLISTTTLEQLLAKAHARGIKIYTSFIATSSPGNPDWLRSLAEQTGGQVLRVDGEPQASLALSFPKLLAQLFEKEQLCQLAYRTQQAQPRSIRVETNPPDRLFLLVAAASIGKITVPPPTVTLARPSLSQPISPNITTTVAITIDWGFNNDYPDRHIRTVSYTIEGPTTRSLSVTVPMTAPTQLVQTIQLTPLITGSYLIRAEVVDDVGLVGRDEQPFGLYLPPPEVAEPTKVEPTRPQRVLAWLTEQFATLKGLTTYSFSLFEMIFWSVLLIGLVTLLIYWRLRASQYTYGEIGGVPRGQADYQATLIRIRSDPQAPPLLHMVPLGHQETLTIPDELYHPVWKYYQSNETQKLFTEQYRATLTNNSGQFTIQREPPRKPQKNGSTSHDSPPTPRQEPIRIQVAETAQLFPLLNADDDDSQRSVDSLPPQSKFGPLQSGDILQLGETHYKFMRLNKKPVGNNNDQATKTTVKQPPNWLRRLLQPSLRL